MKTFIQAGDILDFPAPAGGCVAGVPVIIEKAFLVPTVTKAEGELTPGVVEGVVEFPSATGAAAQFATAYWDATNKVVTTTATSNTKIGYFSEAHVANAPTARVKLIPSA